MSATRQLILVEVANIRAGLLAAQNGAAVPQRVGRFCDALDSWALLPDYARHGYSAEVLEALFDVAADVEEDAEGDARERKIIELSLWDVAVSLGLDQDDPQSAGYIVARRERLLRSLKSAATNRFEVLLYDWSLLLRHRATSVATLPGAFLTDVDDVVAGLSSAGVPRRAQAIAAKFHAQLDAVGKMTLAHRPQAEEVDRTQQMLLRLKNRLPAVAYSTLLRARALGQILAAPLSAIPLTVSGRGCIVIGRETFGVTKGRY
jgi:hypothetical protein